jgi:hypothetical protein
MVTPRRGATPRWSAPEKPEQLVEDALEGPSGADQGAPRQVEPHLVAEYADGPGPGPVGLVPAVIQMLYQVEIRSLTV